MQQVLYPTSFTTTRRPRQLLIKGLIVAWQKRGQLAVLLQPDTHCSKHPFIFHSWAENGILANLTDILVRPKWIKNLDFWRSENSSSNRAKTPL